MTKSSFVPTAVNAWAFFYFCDNMCVGLITECLFFFLNLFRAALEAYRGFQARGRIGATATGLHCSSWQCQILNPLNEARNSTCVPMDTSQIHFHWSMTGAPTTEYIYTAGSWQETDVTLEWCRVESIIFIERTLGEHLLCTRPCGQCWKQKWILS